MHHDSRVVLSQALLSRACSKGGGGGKELTLLTQAADGNSGLLPAHYEIRMMLGHGASVVSMRKDFLNLPRPRRVLSVRNDAAAAADHAKAGTAW